jgi:hypothetical protein
MCSKKRRSGVSSSVIVSTAAIITLLVLSAAALRFSLNGLGAFMAVLAFWGLFPVFGANALKMSVSELNQTVAQLNSGERVVFRYTIENKKPLPLMWLEFCTKIPVYGWLSPKRALSEGDRGS